jgi:hypothetical protein
MTSASFYSAIPKMGQPQTRLIPHGHQDGLPNDYCQEAVITFFYANCMPVMDSSSHPNLVHLPDEKRNNFLFK